MAKVVTDGDIGSGLEIVAGKLNRSAITKADVGLGNVDNTSDANKPVSTATQTALDEKLNNPTGLTTDYLPKWNGSGFGNSRIQDEGLSPSANTFNSEPLVLNRTGSYGKMLSMNRVGVGLNVALGIPTSGELGIYINEVLMHSFKPSGIVLLNTTTNNGIDKLQVSGSVSIETFAYLKPSATPSTPREGTVYYDSTTKKLRCFDGTTWNDLF